MANQIPTSPIGAAEEDALLLEMIPGAVAEVDPRQIAIYRRLTPAQRFQQAVSMIELAEDVAAYRLRQRRPDLSEADALRTIRSNVHGF